MQPKLQREREKPLINGLLGVLRSVCEQSVGPLNESAGCSRFTMNGAFNVVLGDVQTFLGKELSSNDKLNSYNGLI